MKKIIFLLVLCMLIPVLAMSENESGKRKRVRIHTKGSTPRRLLVVPIQVFLENNILCLYFLEEIPEAEVYLYNASTSSLLVNEVLSNPDCWIAEISLEENDEYIIEIRIGSQIYVGEFDINSQ